jgi:hypothetical protein
MPSYTTQRPGSEIKHATDNGHLLGFMLVTAWVGRAGLRGILVDEHTPHHTHTDTSTWHPREQHTGSGGASVKPPSRQHHPLCSSVLRVFWTAIPDLPSPIAQQNVNGHLKAMIGNHKRSRCGNGPNSSNGSAPNTRLLSVWPSGRLAARPDIM